MDFEVLDEEQSREFEKTCKTRYNEIFNLIKNENNKYYFVSEELGDALDDNWVELAQYRDEAFDMFKRNKAIEYYKENIDKLFA